MEEYKFIPADRFSLVLFITLCLISFFGILSVVRKTSEAKKWTIFFIALVAVVSWASNSGMLLKQFYPVGPLIFAMVITFALSFALSQSGKEIAVRAPMAYLIGFQGFRFFLELILHQWAKQGTIPSTMTWTGQNWDILAGLLAIVAIPFVNKNYKAAMAVNLVGFVLLLNVMRVVVMSSPLPFGWHLENPLLLIAYFPYALIGPLLVMPAFIGHLLVFRKLKS